MLKNTKSVSSYEGIIVNTLLGSNHFKNDNIPATQNIYIERMDISEERKIPFIGTEKLYDCLEV